MRALVRIIFLVGMGIIWFLVVLENVKKGMFV